MKEMKCKNCGAVIHIDENVKTATCNYCGSTYSAKDQITYNFNINMNDNTKEVFNNAFNSVNNVPKRVISIFIIFFVLSFIMSITFSILRFSIVEEKPDINNWINDNENNKENGIKDNIDISKEFFNTRFEWYEGEQSLFWIDILFDEIEQTNENEERHITVVYKDIEANTKEELDSIKEQLEDKKYNLHFEKDEDGYYYKVTIND